MKNVLVAILIGASLTLYAGVPKQPKVPVPTVESVKAMSVVDLLSGITDSEELMLDNAHNDVRGTLRILIHIHQKCLEKAKQNLAYWQDLADRGLNRAWAELPPAKAEVDAIKGGLDNLLREQTDLTPPAKKKKV